MSVEYKDKGLELIMDKIADLSKLSLTVGFQGDEAAFLYVDESGAVKGNLASIATWNEFGLKASSKNPAVPARPLLRSTVFKQRDKIVSWWAKSLNRMISNAAITPIQTVALVGINLVKMVERQMDASYSWAKPNAPRTIKNKGFDYPWHETGKMRKSITWAVRDRSGHILATGGSNG